MNSCIYICRLTHTRDRPKRNNFNYNIYMLYLDLDEIKKLDRKISIFSYNRRNILSFYDEDHFKFINQKGDLDTISQEKIKYKKKKYLGKDTKERIRLMIDELGLVFELGKVFLLTNVRNLGYIFNPVSFYYCFDKKGDFRALFSEVNNTFGQQKMYYMLTDPKKKVFNDRQRKNYYVSPFIDYDTDLHWGFRLPKKELHMEIDSVKDDKAVIKAALHGKRREITNLNMIFLLFRYPFMTFMIIFFIHFQALRLWLKRVPYHEKKKTDKRIVRSIR